MTNADRILAEIRAHPGLTDSELRVRTGIEPHQQVNQVCRRLAAQGLIRREPGPAGRIVNMPMAGAAGSPLAEAVWASRPESAMPTSGPRIAGPLPLSLTETWRRDRRQETPRAPPDLPTPSSALVIIPCSGSKRPGGGAIPGPSVLDLLPSDLADRLVAARVGLADHVRLDESQVLPAWRRYDGHLYRRARELGEPDERGVAVAILSGGYGVLLAGDSIGNYDHRFSIRDWPPGLLEACIVNVADHLGKRSVIAFCSRTTAYAALVRQVRWRDAGLDAYLASPDTNGRRGSQVIVPRAEGEAVAAFANHTLTNQWASSDGLALDWTQLA